MNIYFTLGQFLSIDSSAMNDFDTMIVGTFIDLSADTIIGSISVGHAQFLDWGGTLPGS